MPSDMGQDEFIIHESKNRLEAMFQGVLKKLTAGLTASMGVYFPESQQQYAIPNIQRGLEKLRSTSIEIRSDLKSPANWDGKAINIRSDLVENIKSTSSDATHYAKLDRALLHEMMHAAGVGTPKPMESTKHLFVQGEVYTKANCTLFRQAAQTLNINEGPAENADSYTWFILEDGYPSILDPANYRPQPNFTLPDMPWEAKEVD
eukprot:TRINITY_DN66706_c0_g1_i1.p1 TRINITY_DN66706_c0_g1~~TRINITY_DN66706_c0_g1_i1.p1  ORF type:complete len:205 (-),score=39.72 TRINITY_DN66706_c0_g1_i1:344-958(-)